MIFVRGQYQRQLHRAKLFVCPACVLESELFAVHDGFHDFVKLGRVTETERIENHVIQLVVLVDEQHYFVVGGGPASVYDIVLVGDKRVYSAVLIRQHLLPDVV